MKYSSIVRALAVVTVGGFVLSAAAAPAQARSAQHTGMYQTGKGNLGTYSTNVTGNSNGHSRESSVTTQNGSTFTRNSTAIKNGDSVTKQTTLSNGNTITSTGTVQAPGSVSGTYTTSTGKSGDFTHVVGKDSGAISTATMYTDQNGNVQTRQTWTAQDAPGVIGHAVVGPNGKEHDVYLAPAN